MANVGNANVEIPVTPISWLVGARSPRTYSITKIITRLQEDKRDHTVHITRAVVAQAVSVVVVQDKPKMLVTLRVP